MRSRLGEGSIFSFELEFPAAELRSPRGNPALVKRFFFPRGDRVGSTLGEMS
ncbi:MAG: hypothetical protein J7647_12715 [Cyanobacteria bacterium SBLK]|nr:hypothetical protein [Cyanobacteria bacterium SBLK]